MAISNKNGKTCRCETCKKNFYPLGIARHRAMHRDKREDCIIQYSDGRRFKYYYSELEAKAGDL